MTIETGSTETQVTTITTTRRLIAMSVLCLLATAACKAKPEAKAATPPVAVDSTAPEPESEPEAEVAAAAPAPVISAPVEEQRSRCDQYTIRETGIGAVEIGDPHEAVAKRCIVLSDSATSADGGSAVAGNTVFGINGTPVVAQIADGKVYRLTVSDPSFRTIDGAGPGVSIVRLLDWPGAVVLEGDHDLSVVVSAHCGLYFRITKPAANAVTLSRWADVVRAMPPDTPVERVVVRGC